MNVRGIYVNDTPLKRGFYHTLIVHLRPPNFTSPSQRMGIGMKYCCITPIIVAALALLFASALHIVGLKGKMSLHAPGEEKEAEADKFHSRSCLCLPSEIFILWWVSS